LILLFRFINLRSILFGLISSTQTAFGRDFANLRRYGIISFSCWHPPSRKYKPIAMTASCALESKQKTPAAFSCGQYRNNVCTLNKKIFYHFIINKFINYTFSHGVGSIFAKTRAKLCTVFWNENFSFPAIFDVYSLTLFLLFWQPEKFDSSKLKSYKNK